ncbi:hypothetical protein LCGC14_0380270 [marine sediment metagenome]|uniref:Uncharacterized protein n=1 Tax=marine sediment metagenome TaxID=412755 RepID=A0A0F9VPM2_9ZZZZ
MAVINYNLKDERTFKINGITQIDQGANQRTLVFIQGLIFALDAGVFTRDFIGTGQSVFTQNGDVIGNGSFNTKNTVDLYDNTIPAVDTETLSDWWTQIANFTPRELDIIQTFNAPKGAGNKFARINIKIRIMKPEVDTDVGQAVDGVNVDFEVIEFTSAPRQAS